MKLKTPKSKASGPGACQNPSRYLQQPVKYSTPEHCTTGDSCCVSFRQGSKPLECHVYKRSRPQDLAPAKMSPGTCTCPADGPVVSSMPSRRWNAVGVIGQAACTFNLYAQVKAMSFQQGSTCDTATEVMCHYQSALHETSWVSGQTACTVCKQEHGTIKQHQSCTTSVCSLAVGMLDQVAPCA